MLSETKSHDPQKLRNLIPLSTLPASRFNQLCSAVRVEFGRKGTLLFRQGDNKNEFVYLLAGKVSLQAGDVEMDVIEGGTEASRFALAHQIPRKINALAKTKIQFVRIDSSLIYSQNEGNTQQSPSYEVSDLPGEASSDWMMELLKSPIFQQLPASNLQKLIMSLEEIPVIEGERIFQQGDTGDYYYIIKSGQCTLTRKPNPHAKEITLAKLRTCDSFGEDALISNQPRNVSITMLTPGVILRLKKDKFLTLVKEPIIRYINYHSLENALEQGSVLVDLRSPDDYENFHLPNSKNIPFFSLRMQLHNFTSDIKPVLICEDGNTSQAAAFLLIQEGFIAEVLRGGLKSFPGNSPNRPDSSVETSYKPKRSSTRSSHTKQARQSSTPDEEIQSPENKDIPKQIEQTLAQLQKDSEQRVDQLQDQLKQSKESNRSLTQDIQALKQKNERYHNDLEKASESTSKLDREIAHLTSQIKEIEGQASTQRSIDTGEIAKLESTIQSFEQTLKQKEDNYHKSLKSESDKTQQLDRQGKQLKQQFSKTQSELEKEITNLKGQLKNLEEQTAIQRPEDSQKISDLESSNKSFEQTLEQKDTLYRKNQIVASERISQLEQEITGLKAKLTETEEQTTTQASADSEKIDALESTNRSIEQTLEQKETQYHKDLTTASEQFAHFAEDRTQLIQQHTESISGLEQEIKNLETQLKENEEIASNKESAKALEKQGLEEIINSLEQTLKQKDTEYYQDLKKSSEKITHLAHDRTEAIQQHAETTSKLEQEIIRLKERLASPGPKDSHREDTGNLLQTKEADYKKQISAFKCKNDSLQINLTQKSEDIKALKSNLHSLQEDNAILHSRLEKIQDGEEQDVQDIETIKNFQQRISELKEQIANTQQDKEEKETQVETLKQKSTELETIHTPADSDFEAMIEQLKTAQSRAEKFKKALRREKKRVAQLESELDQPLTVSADFTATDEEIFSMEDSGTNPQPASAKKKISNKLAFWKS